MARKQKMKVYHGIPKSITDEHTLFYESCDGKLDNSYTVINPISFYPNVTGYGVYGTTIDEFNFALTTECNIQTKVFTVDFWAIMKTPVTSSYAGRLFEITFNNNSNYKIRLEKDSSNDRFHLWENANLVFGEFDFSSANINKPHHFRIIFKVGDYCKMYIDGKEPNIVQYQNKLTTSFEYISHIRLSGSNFSISDFHISNIDRGDYFPNLPQDFIDGKAVIKPRMGQQQIKGDPMYSQVTDLKVEAFTGVEYPTLVDNNYYMHRHNPELSVKGANHWNAGSSFRIKGLNGEIISGVIDTDTALCRITKYIDGAKRGQNYVIVEVDSLSKLIVGDTIRLYYNVPSDNLSTLIYTVSEVYPTTNQIKLTGDGTYSYDVTVSNLTNGLIIETTASSSSPTVKTKEGTNVVGTWSGLGTSEATFTLGENTSITGQDLYVTYALTMPLGNSDFPEIPYSIEKAWGENGVEMKPVNEITITDDFKGKIGGSIKECPHIAKQGNGTSLLAPSSSNLNDLGTTARYGEISFSDGTCRPYEIRLSNNSMPQQTFSFNVIELIEGKLGVTIPSVNKVTWIRNNLSLFTFKWIGYGQHPTGSYAELQLFNAKTNAYVSWAGKSHTSSTPNTITYGTGAISNSDIIDDQGFAHCTAFTKPSDGVTASTIYTDYVTLEIKLNVDSTYTTLYCDNKRAREDVCNPVLIQKETKTVKRYLPSKEIFSTECTRHSYKDNLKSEVGKCLVVSTDKLVTTSGTSTYATGIQGVDTYADKFILPGDYKWYDFDNTPLQVSPSDMVSVMSHSVKLPIIRYWGGRCYHGAGSTTGSNGKLDGCQTITTVSDSTNVKQYEMYYALKTVNNELVLTVQTGIREANNKYQPSLTNVYDYKLPNRPLIK